MPHSISPRQWNPSRPGNAPRIKPETWQKYRDKITTLHNEGSTKNEILAALDSDMLAKEHDFHPTYVCFLGSGVKLTCYRMGQLIPKMKAWELYADQRKGSSAIAQAYVAATDGPTAVKDSHYCVKNDADMNDDQFTVDTPTEAATWTPQVHCRTPSLGGCKLINLQEGQMSTEKDATVCKIDTTNEDSGLDTPDDGPSLGNGELRLAGSHTPRDSLLLYSTRPEEPVDISRHDDASSIFDYDRIVDDSTRRASPVSTTPPLTFAETSSTGDGSPDGETGQPERPWLPNGRPQPLPSSNSAGIRQSDAAIKPMSGVRSVLMDGTVLSCELLTLWPEFLDPQKLPASQLGEIRAAATTLAAAGIHGDAFGLFYVEYVWWQACNSITSTNESIRKVVTATVNCARACMPGRQEEIAKQMLGEAISLLTKLGFGESLDSALLHLYLTNLVKPVHLWKPQYLAEPDSVEAVDCGVASFTLLLPEIQDREYMFMAQCFEATALRYFSRRFDRPNGSAIFFGNITEQKLAGPKHLRECEDVTRAFTSLLHWCKEVIRRNRRTLDEAGCLLPATVFSLLPAAWVFYCCCVFEIFIINPAVQNEPAAFRMPICSHWNRELMLDAPLALAVITESFCSAETTTQRIIGTEFSGQCMGQIDEILHNRLTRCQDIAGAYFSRITALPQVNEGLDLSGSARAILVKDFVVKAVRGRHSPSRVGNPTGTRTAATVFPSPEVSRGDSPRSSIECSIRSSLNTIRSSMSLDLKQMVELKQRLRRPTSFSSIRSKDTTNSHATSTNPRDSDTFESVTGMPSCGPVAELGLESTRYKDTVTIERIDEEMHDAVMNDDT